MKRHESRLLFLKQFTKELILNSKTPELKKAEEETGREKFEILTPPLVTEEKLREKTTEIKPAEKIPEMRYKLRIIPPYIQKPKIMPPRQFIPAPRKIQAPSSEFQPQFQPQAAKEEFDLGKLNFLVKDPKVTVIECPGPNKLILAKTFGETKVTKVSLTQEEIQGIAEQFSKKAKIPLISGLFKAVVGNLIITAVISELVGSRFIITKMTPQYMLEQQSLGH